VARELPKFVEDVFISPPRYLLQEALRKQGVSTQATLKRDRKYLFIWNTSALFLITTVGTQLYTVSIEILADRSFGDLLEDPKLKFTSSSPLVGYLTTNFKEHYGGICGSFKTAHIGQIRPQSHIEALSFPWGSKVCIKRPYNRQQVNQSRTNLWRLPVSEELETINQELKCIPFASSLMQLVYAFISREVKKVGLPSFSIPQMRYVKAARGRIQPNGGAFLIEELIEAGFVKYTNNQASEPLPWLEGNDLRHAKFLCFAQHVQWEKTEQQVFISDFQGLS